MPRVLICDKLENEGLEYLQQTGITLDNRPGLKGEELKAALQAADGAIVRSGTRITAELVEQPGKLRAVVRAGVGVDNIDVPAATRKGIVVMNTPGGNTLSTAEQTLALMFALVRNLPAADLSLKQGKWERTKFTGSQLAGKTLGVIGLGRIGREVAKRALAMDMKVIGYDPLLTAERIAQYQIGPCESIDKLVSQCDILTLHVPLTPETKNLIGAREIGLMKKGARILNCARGGLVNEEALAAALQSGHLAGAACDVFVEEPPPADHPLLKLPNFVGTPHLGASTTEAQRSVAIEAAQLLADYLLKGQIQAAVNTVSIDKTELKELRPYLNLAHRLGMFISQVQAGGIRRITLTYRGDIAKRNTRLLTSAFAVGLLAQRLDEPVNLVNAELLAQERGIDLAEQKISERGDFSTKITAEAQTDHGPCKAAATLFGSQFLRLVQFGDYHLEGYLDGTLLLFSHRDAPGLIGFIGTVFGKHQVNIAQMVVGRNTPGGDAVAVLQLDAIPSEEALREVKDHPQIRSVQLVKLPPAGEMPAWLG
jgi:D-3-phosphoglycerate dehydrogenase